jgi:hypothetical protein
MLGHGIDPLKILYLHTTVRTRKEDERMPLLYEIPIHDPIFRVSDEDKP